MSTVHAVVVPCDAVYTDRGKVTVLGAMWNGLSHAGRRDLQAMVFLNVQRPDKPADVILECRLRVLESDEVVAGTSINLELAPEADIADAVELDAEFQTGAVPIRWSVDLAPETAYVIEVLRDGVTIAANPFRVGPALDADEAAHSI